jgi:hypothetical protein
VARNPRHPNVSALRIAKRFPVAPPRERSTSLRLAVMLSLAMHGALVGLLALLASTGAAVRSDPFGGTPLTARLTTPAQKFVVPVVEPAPLPESAIAPSSSVGQPASLPVPLDRKAAAKPRGTPQGVVWIEVQDEATPLDPALENVLRNVYPDALRQPPDFEIEPAALYPEKALPRRRQAMLDVLVIVREDGSVEAAPGTLADPVFGDSIRAALAGAKARPAVVDGQPRQTWSLLRFAYEFVGVRE